MKMACAVDSGFRFITVAGDELFQIFRCGGEEGWEDQQHQHHEEVGGRGDPRTGFGKQVHEDSVANSRRIGAGMTPPGSGFRRVDAW